MSCLLVYSVYCSALCWSPLTVTTTTEYFVPAVRPMNAAVLVSLPCVWFWDLSPPSSFTLYPVNAPSLGSSQLTVNDCPVVDSSWRVRGTFGSKRTKLRYIRHKNTKYFPTWFVHNLTEEIDLVSVYLKINNML